MQCHVVARPCNATPSLFADAMVGQSITFLRGVRPTLGRTRVEASRVGWVLVLAGSFGFRNLLFSLSRVHSLARCSPFDGRHFSHRRPTPHRQASQRRACVSCYHAPLTAALQIVVELRVDCPRVVEARRELVNL